jgi:luciferase family oxidoreductase group 1
VPPIWLLGSSDYSGELAAQVGLGFAFAQHFASYDAADAIGRYRDHFRASQWLDRPHAILTTHAICAETDEEAERLASSADLNYLRRNRGEYGPLSSPEEALAYVRSPAEERARQGNRSRLIVGSPARVRETLLAMVEAVRADELMLMTAVFDHAARLRSYELLAEAFGLEQRN